MNSRECRWSLFLNEFKLERIKFIGKSSKRQRIYTIGDIMGLKVSYVDCTNISFTILSCKMIHSNIQEGETFYNVATSNGMIKQSFLSTAFLDLTSSDFSASRSLENKALLLMIFIQTCQCTNCIRSTTCKCTCHCTSNLCQCKKNNRVYCSKCHNGNGLKCRNW